MLAEAGAAPSPANAGWHGALKKPHFPIKARRVIHLCMAGGPSHLETFDWKPELKRLETIIKQARKP